MQKLQVRAKHPGNFAACEIPEQASIGLREPGFFPDAHLSVSAATRLNKLITKLHEESFHVNDFQIIFAEANYI